MSTVRMALCDECHDEELKWLDHRGPLSLGVKIGQSGNPLFSIPSHSRTHETLKQQLRLIRETCLREHRSQA